MQLATFCQLTEYNDIDTRHQHWYVTAFDISYSYFNYKVIIQHGITAHTGQKIALSHWQY